MTFDPISYSKRGLNWNEIKAKLKFEGALNVKYDDDIDGVIDKISPLKGDLDVNGNNILNVGGLSLKGSITLDADNTHSIGSSTSRLANIYCVHGAFESADFSKSTGDSVNINTILSVFNVTGASNNRVMSIHGVDHTDKPSLLEVWSHDGANWHLQFKVSYDSGVYAVSVLPVADSVYDLGSSTNRWKDGHFAGSLEVSGGLIYGGYGYTGSMNIVANNDWLDTVNNAFPRSAWLWLASLDTGTVEAGSARLHITRDLNFTTPNEPFFDVYLLEKQTNGTATAKRLFVFNYDGSFIPAIDNTGSIGSATNRWGGIHAYSYYVDDIRIVKALIPTATNPGLDIYGGSLRFYGQQGVVVTIDFWDWAEVKKDTDGCIVISTFDGATGTVERLRVGAGASSVNITVSNAVIIPSVDNTGSLGTATNRFAEIHCVTLYQGDSVLENGWRITEKDDNGNVINGVRILNDKGEEIFRIDEDGMWFKGNKIV